MKAMRSLKLVLAASLMFSGLPAFSGEAANKKIKESGNWSLWEANSGATCYIQSSGESEYLLNNVTCRDLRLASLS